jgi:transcriptional regulator with XRE-family HTH domain
VIRAPPPGRVHDCRKLTRKHEHFRRLPTDARRQAGMTHEALARRLGRPQSFVSKFERGERRLAVIEFLDVAHALNIDPAQLIGDLDRALN